MGWRSRLAMNEQEGGPESLSSSGESQQAEGGPRIEAGCPEILGEVKIEGPECHGTERGGRGVLSPAECGRDRSLSLGSSSGCWLLLPEKGTEQRRHSQ